MASETKLTRLLFYLLIFGFASCKITERFDQMHGKIPERSLQDVMRAIDKNSPKYSFIEAKIHFAGSTDDFEGSADITLRLDKDRMIWASLRKLGIEGGRLMVSPDSVSMINRLERTYFKESFTKMLYLTGYDFDFYEIQNLITAKIPGKPLEKASFSQEETNCKVVVSDSRGTMTYEFNAYNLLLQRVSLRDTYGNAAAVEYLSYSKIQGEYYPKEMDVRIASRELAAEARLEFREITINSPKEMSFSIPSRYEEISF